MSRRLGSLALLMSIAASLAACGGGGDDGSSAPAPSPAPAPAPVPAPPPSSGGPFAITGKAVYESVPTKTDGTGLNYAAATDKPIREATVQLLDAASAVLATTTTDTSGNYTFSLATSQAVKVRVRAEMKRTGSASGDRDITVRDNTSGEAVYALDSAAFTPTAAVTQNVRAASGWGGSSYTTTRAAGPFALLDVVYSAQAKIATVAPTVTLPPLKVFWSVNNQPASGNIADGNIVTSYFTTLTGGGRALYVLGKANTDTDEYDTHVIAHEFGHYIQSALSRDDSVGGSHSRNDKLDARVAFSEGWGNAWSGIVFGDPLYTDTFGANQATSFNINVSTPAAGVDRGFYSETTAQYLIWTTSQTTTGFGPVYTALTTFPSSPAFSSLYTFAAAVKAASPGNAAAVTSLFATQQVVAQDAFGTGETNGGGVTGALPVYKTHSAAAGSPANYCVNATADSGNDSNKLGEYVYIRFTIATAGSHVLTVVKTSPAGAATTDPDFTLLKADGTEVDAFSGVDDMETLTVTLPTGTHTIALSDFKLVNPNTSCFNFTVN